VLLCGEQAPVVSILLGMATAAAAGRSARYVGLTLSHGGGVAGHARWPGSRSRHGRGDNGRDDEREAGGGRASARARAGATAAREGREEERAGDRAEEGGGHAGGRQFNEWTRGGYEGGSAPGG
jgi:hypothetical protein